MNNLNRITRKANAIVGDLLKAASQRTAVADANVVMINSLISDNTVLREEAQTATDMANVIGIVLTKKEQ